MKALQPLISALPAKPVKTYPQLRKSVREAIREGKERAHDAVEREKVRTAWEIGKLIIEHVLENADRADYGARVLRRLSQDLGISYTELKYMREFAQTYPEIGRISGQLSWGHYQALLRINSRPERKELADTAIANDWTVQELRRKIKKLKTLSSLPAGGLVAGPNDLIGNPLPPLNPGKPGVYQIIRDGALKIDLGFSCHLDLPAKYRKKFKKGGIVAARGASLVAHKDARDLFSYNAYIEEVIDGDTLWAKVDMGFGITTKQKLRLRGINAPELISRDGARAKKFVEALLRGKDAKKQEKSTALASGFSASALLRTSKADKYDRYLADVFVNGVYLNQALVEAGLAGVAG